MPKRPVAPDATAAPLTVPQFVRLAAAGEGGWVLLVGAAISRVAPASLPIASEGASALATAVTDGANLTGDLWNGRTFNVLVAEAARDLKFEVLVSRLREHVGDRAVAV